MKREYKIPVKNTFKPDDLPFHIPLAGGPVWIHHRDIVFWDSSCLLAMSNHFCRTRRDVETGIIERIMKYRHPDPILVRAAAKREKNIIKLECDVKHPFTLLYSLTSKCPRKQIEVLNPVNKIPIEEKVFVIARLEWTKFVLVKWYIRGKIVYTELSYRCDEKRASVGNELFDRIKHLVKPKMPTKTELAYAL